MAVTITAKEDGLTLRNTGGTAVATKEKPGPGELHIDCAEFRQFLSDAKSGKFDDLV